MHWCASLTVQFYLNHIRYYARGITYDGDNITASDKLNSVRATAAAINASTAAWRVRTSGPSFYERRVMPVLTG